MLKIHNTKIPESLLTMSTNSRINDLQFDDDTQVGALYTNTHAIAALSHSDYRCVFLSFLELSQTLIVCVISIPSNPMCFNESAKILKLFSNFFFVLLKFVCVGEIRGVKMSNLGEISPHFLNLPHYSTLIYFAPFVFKYFF